MTVKIPDEVVQSPYFTLLSVLLGEVGAGEYDYLESYNNCKLRSAVVWGWVHLYVQKWMTKTKLAHGNTHDEIVGGMVQAIRLFEVGAHLNNYV